MSLRVWLPLTKDLRNQGLDDVIVTNNGATFNSAGKLGGCYAPNGLALTNLGDLRAYPMTIAFWCKTTNTGTPSWEQIILIDNTSNSQIHGIYVADASRLKYEYNPSVNAYSVNPKEWHHYTFIIDNTNSKVYVDGVLNSSSTETVTADIIGRIRIGTTTTIQLNDVRIYDHCLSPMEVKELSKGLVLHYPLNRGGWGQENLITHSGNFVSIDGWTNNQNTTLSTENNELKVVINQTSSTPGIKSTNTINLPAGTYTGSLLIKVQNGNKNYIDYPFYLANAGGTTAYGGTVTKREVRGNYIYEEATFTTTSAINGVIVYVLTSGPANGEIWHLKWLKLEKGSVATPWCPNSSDALATTMGLNGTTEYDCSGFCNNGTRTGTFSWTSDTPKYQVSTTFDGTNYISTTTPGADILTLSCWVKTSKNKSTSQIMVADSTSQLCISFYSGTIITFYASNGYSTGSKCTLGSTYKENDWNHLVVVKTGTGTRKVYCNGVEQTATSNDYWSSSSTGFTVARRETSTPNAFYGELCDVRAYATALSADDVKALYQNSAYIDSNGNVYGAVHSEV